MTCNIFLYVKCLSFINVIRPYALGLADGIANATST